MPEPFGQRALPSFPPGTNPTERGLRMIRAPAVRKNRRERARRGVKQIGAADRGCSWCVGSWASEPARSCDRAHAIGFMRSGPCNRVHAI
eukprot:3763945-Prymnesium_polylepis.1